MISRPNRSLSLPAAAFLSAGTVFAFAGPIQAQGPTTSEMTAMATPAPPEAFPFEIGHAAKAGTVYIVSATQPATSKLTGQKIRLKIFERTGVDTATRYFMFATGKYKTVAQLDTILAETFRRFLATPPPAAGQELGKIGDLKHGGEVRFIATSTDILRFDNISPNEAVRASEYSRTDIEGLLAALNGLPSN